ncbi:MAG: 4-hydroxy-3-methylbut-2-enyl diphosphate reductase [Thermodesulfobacteriota bacterium]
MKIIIAKSAGFCMGVRKAVELALDTANKNPGPIYTFGDLIHNPQATALLGEKGICVMAHAPEQGDGTLLIRAHGVPPETKEQLEKAGFTVKDATCPRVIKVQLIIQRHARQGYTVIIIGEKDHPEVVGLTGYAEGKGLVIDNLQDLEDLPGFDKAIIVAQTTQNTRFYDAVKEWAARKFPHYRVFDTICDSTEKRQREVARLAEIVDAVIVVGGHHSGNTRRLVEVAQSKGKPAFQIETEEELDLQALEKFQVIGITAGASTPNWIIKKVYRTLETELSKKDQKWRRFLYAAQQNLLLTNIYVALGSGCLCYASMKLISRPFSFASVLIAVLYVLSMHMINNLTGRKSDRYNDPERAIFYNKYRRTLAALAIIAGVSGLVKSFQLGPIPFMIILAMSVMGLLYNIRLVPDRFSSIKYRRIKDIPGSKTILITIAWGIVAVILPVLSVNTDLFAIEILLVFVWCSGLVFIRTAFFDILDMQGDRIVGKETIPILMGQKNAMRMLKALIGVNLAILFFSSMYGVFSTLGFALAVCPLFTLAVLLSHEKSFMPPGIKLEFLVESGFILAGIITFLWTAL